VADFRQDRCSKYGHAKGLSALPQEPAHRKISTQDFQATLAHLEDHSQLGDGPRPQAHDSEEIEFNGREDDTRKPVRTECGTKGFNACNGVSAHRRADSLSLRACYDLKGSTQIRVGELSSFPRQEGRENLEPEILLIPIAVGAPLNHADLVIQSFDQAQLDLVAGGAIRHDAVPVPFDQGGKSLKGAESLPLELFPPAGEELARPACPTRRPELPELLLEQVGRGQALVGPQQLLERAAAGQREIGLMREQRVPLALDEGPLLRGDAFVLGAADLIHRVRQMAQDVELVEENLSLGGMGLHRGTEGFPHVHHRQPNPGRLLGAQVDEKAIQVGFGPAPPADPDGAPPFQVADHDAIRMALVDRQLIHADHLRGRLGRLGQPGPQVLGVQVLDRVLVQVQQLGHGLVRQVPTQGAYVVGKPLGIARILRQPIQPLHLYPLTARAGHAPLLERQIEAPAGGISIPHSARRAVIEGAVPRPTARAHGRFFRRTRVTSRAWGSPKIPCSRLRARNPGNENNAESVWTRFMVPPGHMRPGVCHRSRTRFETRPIRPNHRPAAWLEKKTLSH